MPEVLQVQSVWGTDMVSEQGYNDKVTQNVTLNGGNMAELYSFKEAREILQVGKKAFQALIDKGEVKTVGRRVARAELERILEHPVDTADTALITAHEREILDRVEKREAELKSTEQAVRRYIEQMSERRMALKIEVGELKAEKKILIADIEHLKAEKHSLESGIQLNKKGDNDGDI